MAYPSDSLDGKVTSEVDTDAHGVESEEGSHDSHEKILEEAKARFKLAEEAESEIRRDALDDLKFAAGEQWDPLVEQARREDRRPCFTINRLPQHIKQVTNDQRQNRPSIKVHPVDDSGDVETAKIYSGVIRHIEYNSNADTAYDTAFDHAVRGGRGFWRIITDYVSPMSFDQEILIKRIRNSFSVFFDPYSQEPDGSDANYAFIVEDIAKDEYMKRYPDSKLAQKGEWESLGNSAPGWMGDTSARVAEYFYKENREETLVLLSSGDVVLESELDQIIEIRAAAGEAVQVVQKRKTQIPAIKWCKLNGCEILEITDWPGSFIPVVPVYGEELDIDGKRILKGIVRDAKDPQRLVNYWKSAEAEAIALAPKAPYIADARTIEGFEDIWATANTQNHAYLPFNSRPDAPPPQRQAFEPAVQAITQAAMLAADDLKATTGIHDASLGARSNETSGIAIQRRNVQAQTSNFHFVDNLTRSQRHTGRILLDLIPKIYDTGRTARILGEDGEPQVVKLNEPFEKDGKLVTYDLSVGKYDATIDVGPSYASKRQEAAASMMEVTRAVPQMMQVAGDLMVKNMDWPGAQEIAERLKKTLPPNLIDDPNKPKELPPEVQAQMAQMNQMVEQLTGKLNELQSEREQKLLELQSKERIEFAKLETQLEIKRAELDHKDGLALLNAQIAEIEGRMSLLGAGQPLQYASEQGAQFEQEQPSYQEPEFSPYALGAEVAPEGFGEMDPTGGESPGLPIEGMMTDVD